MGIAAILFNGAEPFKQIVSIFSMSHVKSGENCSSRFREEIKNYTFYYNAQGQGQITPRGQNFDCN